MPSHHPPHDLGFLTRVLFFVRARGLEPASSLLPCPSSPSQVLVPDESLGSAGGAGGAGVSATRDRQPSSSLGGSADDALAAILAEEKARQALKVHKHRFDAVWSVKHENIRVQAELAHLSGDEPGRRRKPPQDGGVIEPVNRV